VIHFLNVGQGDCTIIEFPSGRLMLVDINNGKTLDHSTRDEVLAQYRATRINQQNLSFIQLIGNQILEQNYLKELEGNTTDPIAYLDHWLPGRDFFRVAITHPDMDHMTGLHRLHAQTNRRISNFWHSGSNDFNLAATTDDEWASCPYDKRDWECYKELRASTTEPTSLRLYTAQTGQFWTDDGVAIWAPSPALERKAEEIDEPNAISMVLSVTFAGRTVVLGGDATTDESWPDIWGRVQLPTNISVLKASHHGRKTGYHQQSVQVLSPWLTITSVGQAEHDATESYRRYSDYTVSLRDAGDIRITINEDGQWFYSPDLSPHWKPKKVHIPPPPPLIPRRLLRP